MLCEITSVGLLTLLDDVGDGERLARTGDAQQRLVLRAGLDPFRQLRNRLRLVAGGLVWGNELEHAVANYEPGQGVST